MGFIRLMLGGLLAIAIFGAAYGLVPFMAKKAKEAHQKGPMSFSVYNNMLQDEAGAFEK